MKSFAMTILIGAALPLSLLRLRQLLSVMVSQALSPRRLSRQ